MIRRRLRFESRNRKFESDNYEYADVKKIFDDYQKFIGIGMSPYLVYDSNNRENSIRLPKFSEEEISLVQDAINNDDISLCMDVLDKIDDSLEEYTKSEKYSDSIYEKLQALWNSYLDKIEQYSDVVIFNNDGQYSSSISEWRDYNPVFCSIECHERENKHLMKLRDAILDLFR